MSEPGHPENIPPPHHFNYHNYTTCGARPTEAQLGPLTHRESVSGYTPLHLAVISGRLDVVHILLADPRVNTSVLHGASVTPLYRAIEAELDNVVVALLESGKVNVNASVSAHVSPIYPAAAMGHETLLRILLDHPGSDLVRNRRNGY